MDGPSSWHAHLVGSSDVLKERNASGEGGYGVREVKKRQALVRWQEKASHSKPCVSESENR